MAIDTAARRRNVGRMLSVTPVMGLAPSSGLSTDDRVNAGRAYIGLSYTGEQPPEPEPDARRRSGPRRKAGVGS